jgi:predicted ATPase/DNA-binding SARP family transcriptional activator
VRTIAVVETDGVVDEGPVQISVLGPLRVRSAAGHDLTPSGALQRRLLALLVQCRGDVVSTDAAVESLWPSDPPQDAAAALQNHVFRLRSALPAGLIESVGSGYRLDPGGVATDLDRVTVLLAGDLDEAARLELAGLLQRWHGPAFPELADTEAGLLEAAHTHELRIRAAEALADARLAAEDLDGLIPELMALVDEEPLRERPRALLMSALVATGRTVDAIRSYDDFRRLLGDELGIEPSPALAAQHAALLQGVSGPLAQRRLPTPTTDLVGRDALLDELLSTLEERRVVTLVGPGGIGKTRLLVELGHRLLAQRPDRPVVLCELASADAATTADAVTTALGIDVRPGVPPLERIVDVLGDDPVVLLLDNCEHVLEPSAALVDRIAAHCPNVTVVATSRERLRVAGEAVRPVPTLLGNDGEPGVRQAVDLFVRRARAVRADFDPDAEDLGRIEGIVTRLDGLPLAIELAAARLHALELEELADGLDEPLSLLGSGYRSTARHSSLTAVVSWSYGMLDGELQQVFAAMTVFTRPFTLEAAAAVCGRSPAETAGRLAELVERSLVVRAPGRRYALLETLRAYGAEQLAVSGAADLVRDRHARWFLAWAEDAGGHLHDPDRPVVDEIDDALPELQAAMDWFLDHDAVDEAAGLVAALITYALLRLRPDVLAWAERVLAVDPGDCTPAAAQVWAAAAYQAWMAGDLAGFRARSERAANLGELDPAGLPTVAAIVRGNQGLFDGRLDTAVDWYRRGIEAADGNTATRLIAAGAQLLALGYAGAPEAIELGDSLLHEIGETESAVAAYVWYCAGESQLALGSDWARASLVRAIEIAERTSASFVRGVAGSSKASIEARVGDPSVAVDDFRWLIPHWQRAGMWSTQWTTLRSIAGLLERLGRHRDAAVLEGAIRSTQAGHRIFGADELALQELGERLRAALGDEAYEAALRDGGELDGPGAIELALRCL